MDINLDERCVMIAVQCHRMAYTHQAKTALHAQAGYEVALAHMDVAGSCLQAIKYHTR